MMRFTKDRLPSRQALVAAIAFLLAFAVPTPACRALVEGQGHRCAVDTASGNHLCCAHLVATAMRSNAPVMQDAADCSTELRARDPAVIAENFSMAYVVAAESPTLEARLPHSINVVPATPSLERAGPAPPLFILHSAFLI